MLWLLPLMGLLFIGMGLWQSSVSLDTLWQRQERYLLARGLSPQRSEFWEQNARRGGVAVGIFGVMLMIVGIGLAGSVPQKMSGVSVNGHELTQQQWDSCHHDETVCLSAYMNGQMR